MSKKAEILRTLELLVQYCAEWEARIRKLCVPVAWLFALMLVFVTLCPIELRPKASYSAAQERFSAFVLAGILFALAYTYFFRTIIILISAIAVLEFAQNLTVTRHGGVVDFFAKAAGAALGIGITRGLLAVAQRIMRTQSQNLMVHSYRTIRSKRDGTKFLSLRHHDKGGPSSN